MGDFRMDMMEESSISVSTPNTPMSRRVLPNTLGFGPTAEPAVVVEFPQRVALADQAAAAIQRAIDQGAWTDFLPSERRLCEMCRVSRPTVRAALHALANDGLIEIQQRQRNRIIRRQTTAAAKPRRHIAIVTHETFSHTPSAAYFSLSEMRAFLHEHGYTTEVFVCGRRGEGAQHRQIEGIVRDERIVCAILVSASREIHQWFARNSFPALVLGSCHDGLPCLDVDYRAIGRHAAGLLLSKGHQRIAYIVPDSKAGGDLACERGFLDVVDRQAPLAAGRPVIVRHDGTPKGLRNQLAILFNAPERPTGLLLAKSQCMISAMFYLLERGLSIPRDVSVICRDRDDMFDKMLPAVAHYTFEVEGLSNQLTRSILKMVGQRSGQPGPSFIVPRFVAGATLSVPPPLIGGAACSASIRALWAKRAIRLARSSR